jgi:hypothetical protein
VVPLHSIIVTTSDTVAQRKASEPSRVLPVHLPFIVLRSAFVGLEEGGGVDLERGLRFAVSDIYYRSRVCD